MWCDCGHGPKIISAVHKTCKDAIMTHRLNVIFKYAGSLELIVWGCWV